MLTGYTSHSVDFLFRTALIFGVLIITTVIFLTSDRNLNTFALVYVSHYVVALDLWIILNARVSSDPVIWAQPLDGK